MNEELLERWGRSRKPVCLDRQQVEVVLQPQRLNEKIRAYFNAAPPRGLPWLDRHETPTSAEILDQEDSDADTIEIFPQLPNGPFPSKEIYLRTQYELLREDAVRSLRDAVLSVQQKPHAIEDDFNGQYGIYEKVHICAVIPSSKGVAIRVTFSLRRAGKQVLWEQSKRLISGGLVVLTRKHDMFKKKAIVATVAARPMAGLSQNPPEIDLFLRSEELEIDPSEEFVMIEDRSSFWEADRHTLLALQRMMAESFPLAEHLVNTRKDIAAPQYILDQPRVNLSSVLNRTNYETYENVNVLEEWPKQPPSDLDDSQLKALRRILTKRLAVIQGPPGTGKTFVSVQAIRVMLANRRNEDPPIVVACQTNHAVDQLLRHVALFEPDFIRLGGRSKDKDVIKKRTLYEVRNSTSKNPPAGAMFGMANERCNQMAKEIGILLSPLLTSKQPLNHRTLENLELLTKAQADSLDLGSSKWIQDNMTGVKDSPLKVWLGDELRPVPHKQAAEDFGFEYEEADLEFEQLRDLEAETTAKDDEEFDTLRGTTLEIADNFTCKQRLGPKVNVEALLSEQDLWKVPEVHRGTVYSYLQRELKKKILVELRTVARIYDTEAAKRRVGRFELDEPIIRRQKVIGMTTTGFSKYRGLLSAMGVKIVLIEEAGETLEAPCTVTCMPSLQHLILVGDHQQLRPHTHVIDHTDDPFWLNISLFERMVNNVQYDTLTRQRRMIPEIRRLLRPIYGDIISDHESVTDPKNRPDVPGMGGVNSLFFTHPDPWPEQRDDQMSCFNAQEANMIVGFVEYLVYNGVASNKITILTFYNGQRKRILSELRNRPALYSQYFNVVTVDSYQGEENEVVCLSLVRSNEYLAVGFLEVINRVCVALSRAQRGFYLFGNGELLYDHPRCKVWTDVINILAGQGKKGELPAKCSNRLATTMSVYCKNHNEKTVIRDPQDWETIDGGCTRKCKGKLPCGHVCELKCHPFSHEIVNCQHCQPSTPPAEETLRESPVGHVPMSPRRQFPSGSDGANVWQTFAAKEPERYERACEENFARLQMSNDQAAQAQDGKDWSKQASLLD